MRVFVACSASDNVDRKYKDLTSNVCTMLARGDNKLVFGGADTGMMGAAVNTFKYEGKKLKGIAELANAKDVEEMDLDKYEVVRTTFERTKGLYESAEVILILPGGIGTLAEIFSMLDEKRTKGSYIPIIIFNYDNFYTPLLNVIKKMHEEHFISGEDIKKLDIVTDVETLKLYLNKLEKRK